ncbi:MAG: lipoprotein [Alysiella sp.]|uniref:LPS translocon maturation chaperone LptM n=1 Tax=Alysiella sp. TaxID=1872483 RepID=UPI0026DCE29F|nr:lipoprotein [Alysiella sp.]MDO4433835.1 lipoprotein [Alysiella sp.]
MKRIAFTSLSALLLCACGYKGKLYLPYENDKAKFAPVQTGIDFKRRDTPKQSNPTPPTPIKQTI